MYPGSYPGASPGAATPSADYGSGGWGSLLAVLEEARHWPADPVIACPNDGEPYRTGPDGRLYCPFDGYRPC